MFYSIYGHHLTDDLRRLWFLTTGDYEEHFKNYKLVCAQMGGFEFKGSYKRLLEIIGLDCGQIELIKTPARYDEIILPDESFMRDEKISDNRIITQEYIQTVDRVRKFAQEHKTPVDCKKLYFSNSRKETQIGEEQLEKFFTSKGYKIIYPEDLSLETQLNYLINCESFASTIGSISHNIIFLPDNTEVILIPRSNNLNYYQSALNRVHNLKIFYVDATLSIFATYIGNFYYFVSGKLESFFGGELKDHDGKYWRENVKNFKRYLKRWAEGGNFNGGNTKTYSYYLHDTDECRKYIEQLQTFERNSRLFKLRKRLVIIFKKLKKIFHQSPLLTLKKILRRLKKLTVKDPRSMFIK